MCRASVFCPVPQRLEQEESGKLTRRFVGMTCVCVCVAPFPKDGVILEQGGNQGSERKRKVYTPRRVPKRVMGASWRSLGTSEIQEWGSTAVDPWPD